MNHIILVGQLDIVKVIQKKSISVEFAVSADHRQRLKEKEKLEKYLDLTRKLKYLWNLKVTFKTVKFWAFGILKKKKRMGKARGYRNLKEFWGYPS